LDPHDAPRKIERQTFRAAKIVNGLLTLHVRARLAANGRQSI
jgi:hypothetical protein